LTVFKNSEIMSILGVESMVENRIELSQYSTNEEIEKTESVIQDEIPEENVHLGEELKMDGTVLEMTSTFTFVTKDLEEEEPIYYSGLQIFTFVCYISSFCIAIIGIVFLFLQR